MLLTNAFGCCFWPLPLAVAFCHYFSEVFLGNVFWQCLLTVSFGDVFQQYLLAVSFGGVFFTYTTLFSILALNVAALVCFRQRCSFDYLYWPAFVVL